MDITAPYAAEYGNPGSIFLNINVQLNVINIDFFSGLSVKVSEHVANESLWTKPFY